MVKFPGIQRGNSRAVTDSTVEAIEVLTGARGDGMHRALLYSDLLNLTTLQREAFTQSLKQQRSGSNVLPLPSSGIEKPHKPESVTATGGFTFIALVWDAPKYRGHAYAEIWRSETDDFSTAVQIATEVTNIFNDVVNMGSTYYYWVRFVNEANVKGPLHGANGVKGETQQSAQQILDQIGGLIEQSHLGSFLQNEIDKIAQLDSSVTQLNIDVPNLLDEVPALNNAVFGEEGIVTAIKADADAAKEKADYISTQTESMARSLIDAALTSDINWDSNSVKLVQIQNEIDGVKTTIETEFFTRTEANEAIAAAASTIEAKIESTGLSLSGNINETYYTQAQIDNAIAVSRTELKAEIEDSNGNSLGALLSSDYYTSTATDSAISTYGDTLKAEIEDPNGSSLGATLFSNYLTETQTNSAIASADQALKAAIEDPSGDSIGATLVSSYFTQAETNSAISTEISQLKATIEDPNGDSIGAVLLQDYETKAERELAQARSITQLESTFEPTIVAMLQGQVTADAEQDDQRVHNASFLASQETLAKENKSLSQSMELLEAQLDDAVASVVVVRNGLVSEKEATASEFKRIATEFGAFSAEVYQNFYTKSDADEAIAQAGTALQTKIDTVSSTLSNDYYAKTATDLAISAATNSLKSSIEDPNGSSLGALLDSSYYTSSETDSAISTQISDLKTVIEDPEGGSIGSYVYSQLYTKSETDTAISNASNTLKSEIEDINGNSIAANLQNNYYTRSSVDSAISTASNNLKSEIEDQNGNSLGASLFQISQTVADHNEQWSMWAVKTSVNNLESSFGLINDGADPIFAVKGAKFAIITAQDPNVLTPVFTVVDGKTVANKLLVDEAHIQSLVTDDLLASRLLVSSTLRTPSINYENGQRSGKFSVDPNGILNAEEAVLKAVTIKNAANEVIMSSNGEIPISKITGAGAFARLDKITASNASTYIAQAYIDELFGENATFSGTVYAQQLEGDVTDLKSYSFKSGSPGLNTMHLAVTVSAMPFNRTLVVNPVTFSSSGSGPHNIYIYDRDTLNNWSGGRVPPVAEAVFRCMGTSSGSVYSHEYVSAPAYLTIPSNQSMDLVIIISGSGTPNNFSNALVQVFKEGGTLS